MRCAATVIVIPLLVTGVAALAAQNRPRFAAASIKPSADNGPGMKIEPRANGDYSVRKVTLSALLASAYDVSTDRIVGAPSWWKTDRFDIDARYERTDPSAPVPPMNALLQSLLEDRFMLVAHRETRILPVYAIRVARSDRRAGPGLQPSAAECAGIGRPANARDRDRKAANGAPSCGAIESPEAFIASGVTMDVLAQALRPPTGRHVVNETGLDGRWDITLQFAPVGQGAGDKPSIFTAVQEQLGLRLEPSTAPLDVLVIDRIDRPTPN